MQQATPYTQNNNSSIVSIRNHLINLTAKISSNVVISPCSRKIDVSHLTQITE
jgi:hypothetical protein